MLDGYRRQAKAQPKLPRSIPALLRDRGTGPHKDELALRLIDGSTEAVDRASYAELYGRSLSVARALSERGVKSRDSVMLLLESRLEFYYGLFGALIVGAEPVAVYPPLSPATLEATLEHLRFIVGRLGVRAVATSPMLFGVTTQVAGSAAIVLLEGLGETLDGTIAVEEDAGDRPVLLQYTSGSLGQPKAIELSTPSIFANLAAIGDAFDMREGDAGFSWLPLYHDMGLHSIFFNLIYLMPLSLLSPIDFLKKPSAWLKAISRYRISHSPAPTFGYSYAARRIRDRDIEGVDLSCWRVAMCGAEPIDAGVLRRFAERFAPYGFRSEAFMAAYGLAESTVAVSFAPPESGLSVERGVVSVGRVIAGHQVRIMGDPIMGDRGELKDGKDGEIQVRGPSRMLGYKGDPQATAETFDGEWLLTGDLGFTKDGELYVIGRKKDLIIRGGKNYYPQDIEAAASEVAGIRHGGVVAFGERDPQTGTEEVVIVAEVSQGQRRGDPALIKAVRDAVRHAVGLQLSDVVLVEKGVVPKTTSGKLRRLECAAMYREQRLLPPPRPSPLLLLAVGVFNLVPPSLQRLFGRIRSAVRRS